MKKIIILFLMILSSILMAEKIPDFTLEKSNGEKLNLYETLNDSTIVIVDFWATWCGPCCKALPHLDSLNRKFENLQVLAVTTDGKRTRQKAIDYVSKNGFGFTVLHDEKRKVQRLLKIKAIPETFLIAPDGEIYYRHIGYKEGDEEELEYKIKEILTNLKLIEE